MTSLTGPAASDRLGRLWRALPLLAVAGLCLGACQTTTVERQTAALTLASDSLAQRQAQSRQFETSDESAVLAACSAVLQDLGFTLEESSVATGLLVASKDRDAIEAGQVTGQIAMAALLTAALGVPVDPVWDRDQKIRVSIVTRALSEEAVLVRATFQRAVRNTQNRLSRVETIDDPLIYREFFERLSQAVFLEAHEL